MKKSEILQTLVAVLALPDGHHQIRHLLTDMRDRIDRDLAVEREIMRQNAINGIARLRAAGLPVGGSRENLAKGLEKRSARSVSLQLQIRAALREHLDRGDTYDDMAQHLNRLGIKTSQGRPWTRDNLVQFLRRASGSNNRTTGGSDG